MSSDYAIPEPQQMPHPQSSIFKKRALKLAEYNKPTSLSKHSEIVEFELSGERYAVESIFISEVYYLKGLTWLPSTPDYVAGVINVRRRIVSVIDLRQFFGLSIRQELARCKTLILSKGASEFAIIVETVLGAYNLDLSNLQNNLPMLTGLRQEFLKGVTYEGIIVLDGEKLLAAKSLVVN